jgi:hypothetical protein
MFDSLNIANQARVFQCPNCKETIDTSAQECRFCHAQIDAGAAEAAADVMAKINQACSDASYLKVAAGAMAVFFGMRFIPFLGLVGLGGIAFLVLAVPVMTIRWWTRFWRIQSDDPEFRRARRSVTTVGIGATVLGLILLAVNVFFLLRPASDY